MIKISENIFNITVYKGEAAYGYCAVKKKSFYSFQGHLMTDARGVPVAMTITAANIDERCQRQFKTDPLINVIAEVKLTHPRN